MSFAHVFDQMMDEDVPEPEEESDVKVLVLSPRCWVVSAPCYLQDPSKHFPAQLCNYLAEFTDFYTNSKFNFHRYVNNAHHTVS